MGDEILEVNGRRCKTMQLTEVMQLKSLLQHVAAASGGKDGELKQLLDAVYQYCADCISAKQIRSSEVEVTVTSIVSEIDLFIQKLRVLLSGLRFVR